LRVRYRAFGWQPPRSRQLLKPRVDPPKGSQDSTRSLVPDSLINIDSLVIAEDIASQDTRIFEQSELSSHGSIARSITVGTNRDLAVNSSLRMRVEGRVANEIDVLATITDENIPIQPDGTTQQINDFDRVSIQVRREPFTLTMGDYELIQRNTQFANIYRNVLGVNAAYSRKGHTAALTGSISKGRFSTNSFQGENGRQGPYQLTGGDGERFVIVLAGSEQVYINGQLQQRGQAQDYIMDYNTGQLTFTARRLITVNDRIVVDFEYAVQAYSRSLSFAQYSGAFVDDRLKLQFSFGREADNPNNPLNGSLGRNEREALRLAGDDPAAALTSGIDSVGFNPDEILYGRRDTVLNGQARVYYERSQDSTEQLYRLTFTQLGPGQGDYVRGSSLVNGNVFTWSPPDASGSPTGDYIPLRVVPLPGRLAVADMRLSYDLTRHFTLFTETAISDQDQNRLSPLDDDDNQDYAARTGIRLQDLPAGAWKLGAEAAYQYVGARYENFDRVYAKEYGRVWNYNDRGQRAIERLSEASVYGQWRDYRLSAGGGYRLMADSLTTLRQEYGFAGADTALLAGEYKLVLLNTQDSRLNTQSRWLRQNGDLYHRFGRFRLGSVLWIEDRYDQQQDTLGPGSFRFWDYTPYLRYTATKLGGRLGYQHRRDQEFLGRMRDKSLTQTYSAELDWHPTEQLLLRSSLSLNQYQVKDTAFFSQGQRNKETLLAALNGSYNSADRGIQASVFYQILSESVARRDVLFVEVTPGLGQYEWIDFNQNGVQELNEFELSVNPLIANYQRVLLPSQTLIPAIALDFSPQLTLTYRQLLPGLPILAPFTTISYLSAQQKRVVPDPRLADYVINLSLPQQNDTSAINGSVIFRQDLYLWRNSPSGDLRLRYAQRLNRQLLSTGFEQQDGREWGCDQRLNFNRALSLENQAQIGYKASFAQRLEGRDYHIDYLGTKPELSWQLNRKFRLAGGYQYTYKANQPSRVLQSYLNTHKIILKSRLNLNQRNNLNARLELLNNDLQGDAAQSLRFELLEGNQPGANAVWSLLITQYLGKNLELTIQYDARTSRLAAPLHTGRMQLRAIF
ncbi:MAG: hypothetical protein ACK51A_08285, partial [Sphingobacteriia bacterium]